MGERKGQNHYYPPDYDPKVGGLNKWRGTHALRERARKLHLGILIIRFEMPYNIWCDGCGNHIGMGVRYNAEKTKVGMYYTTPVYQFRMKCHLCDNHFEIKTDPGKLDYEIVSGARRQENRWDPTDNGQVVPETTETQKRLVDDAMFKLEHGKDDATTAAERRPRLNRLVARNTSVWRDDYAANCALRQNFRKRRNELEAGAEKDRELLQRSSLDLELAPETEEDRHLARLLSLKPALDAKQARELKRTQILTSPALPSTAAVFPTQKVPSLSRNALGIAFKSECDHDTSTRNKNETDKSPNNKGNISTDASSPNICGETLNTERNKDEHNSETAGATEAPPCKIEAPPCKIEAGALALVGDYSSGEDST